MGAMLENLIRAIPWGDFWEPVTTRQKWVKWTFILLVLFLGISLFLFKLDALQAYEYALKNPVILEAEKEVVSTLSATGYDIYVSYSYDGVEYEHIYYGRYSTGKGDSDIIWNRKDHMVIAVDPNNPGVPIKYMFREITILLIIVLWSLGFSMLVYGIALEFPQFRNWRVSCANRPGFLSRPYGKPVKCTENPDYPKDFAFFFVPFIFISTMILALIFPYTFS